MKTRIYRVAQKTNAGVQLTLVRATNRVAAERHVSEATITADVCPQEYLVEAVMAGAKIEDAGSQPVDDAESA